jgi:23S rRNA (cytosine1962-C5)-methyltransferase
LPLTPEKFTMFRNRLGKVYRHLSKQAKRKGVGCYRVYDHDLPEFPFRIELYGDKLYVAEYKRKHGMTENEHASWLEGSVEVMKEVIAAAHENIYLKLRMRKPGRLGQYQRLETSQHEFIVEENGLKFIVNLSDYLDTGLFLDHRITRQLVREQAGGKRVLNLFAYTGSFSVYAAAGGAAEIVTVDLSNTYLNWAERNLKLNFPDHKEEYRFVQADVKQYLPELPGGHYDLVVLDPPTFSNSKRMEDILDIQRDHVTLVNQALAAMKPGGTLYFSVNYTKFELDEKAIRASEIKDITKATLDFDFEGRTDRRCFRILK